MARAFGPYTLHRVLGKGGMAEVFVASRRDDPARTPLVIKRIRPEVIHDPEYAQRMQFEAQVASRIHHDSLVRVIEYGRVGNCPYLALELVRGYNLVRVLDFLRRTGTPPPIEVSLTIALGLLGALGALHNHREEDGTLRPILHRDVTPQNVILTRDGRPVLIDLGIAKDVHGPAITQFGQIVGTARYMAPEHRQAMYTDARADVFSVGILLFELLAARAPWPGLSPGKELLRVVFDSPEISAEESDRLPPDVRAVVFGAIACDAEDRWPDAAAMAKAIAETEIGAGLVADEARDRLDRVALWLGEIELAPDEDLDEPVIDHDAATDPAPENDGKSWTAAGQLADSDAPEVRTSQIPEAQPVTIPPLPPRRGPDLSTRELNAMAIEARPQPWPLIGLGALLVIGAFFGYWFSAHT